MPNVDGKSLSPDEAMLLGLCPECGAPLIPRTARAHAESHWGADPDAVRLSEEGRRRFKLILDFVSARVQRPALGTSQIEGQSVPRTAPTNNFSVVTFCELLGFMFGLPAGDALYHGDKLSARMIVFAIIGLSFVFFGPNWIWLKSRLPRRFSASIVRVGSDFRWWIAILLVGFLYGIVGRSQSPQTTGNNPLRISSPTIPSSQTSSPTPMAFSQQFLDNLTRDFLRLPRPCVFKILAPPELDSARSQLVSVAMNASVGLLKGSSFVIPPCQIVDEEKDRTPLLYGPHEFPTTGITIHTSQGNIETREFLAQIFRSQGIQVTGDSVLLPNSPDNLIYMELGYRLYP